MQVLSPMYIVSVRKIRKKELQNAKAVNAILFFR